MRRILCIDRRDATLEMDGAALRVRLPDGPSQTVPLALLERVVLLSDVSLASSVLPALGDAGVGLVAFGGRGGRRVSHLVGSPHGDARIRLAQCLMATDPLQRSAVARHFVRGKIRAQLKLLRTALDARPDERRVLTAGVSALTRSLETLTLDEPGDDRLRGIEGASAAAYFRGLIALFAPGLGFSGRLRRPPPDPVNACLSLGYTLALQGAVHACWMTGLDPAIGFLHTLAHGRPSLACDLLEPWRASVDEFVWSLFRDGTLRDAHFGRDGSGACLLGKTGRSHFYEAWQGLRPGLDRGMGRQARALARALQRRDMGLMEWEGTLP